MYIHIYYYACFGAGDYSDDIEYDSVSLTESQEREVIRGLLNGDEISDIECVQEILDSVHDDIYEIEESNFAEAGYCSEDDDEELDLDLTIYASDIDFSDFVEDDYKHIFDICMKAKDYDLIKRLVTECDDFEDVSTLKYCATIQWKRSFSKNRIALKKYGI